MRDPIDVHKVFARYFIGCEALAYALSSKLGDGNIAVDIEKYKQELPHLLEVEKAKEFYKDSDERFWVHPEEFAKQCISSDFVTHSTTELKPFVICKGKAYLHRYFTYETEIIANIERLGNNFHIITGGPGSGKTYSVSTKLVKLFEENPDLQVALAAPTGKAAVRMNESIRSFAENPKSEIPETVKSKLTGLNAQTIHRLLGYVKNSVFFRCNERNQLPFDVVIIDECSMIDGAMMAKLLNAIDAKTTLYLIGDKDQLASVEAGSVFGDLCRAEESTLIKGKVETKTKSFRFDADKGIGKFSREVIKGIFTTVSSYDADEQIGIDLHYDENIFKENALKYRSYIRESDPKTALQKLNSIRFLCVTRLHDRSVADTNKKIEWILRNEINDSSLFHPQGGFYHNQPIIVTRNDYTLNLFNGDVGLIRKEDDRLTAYFEATDGTIRKIPAGYLNYFDTVFAMTIHKSQGSEFDEVVILLPEKQGGKLLTRELLYTGVTRAKKRTLIQSTEETLLKCVSQEVSRSSGIRQRLIDK